MLKTKNKYWECFHCIRLTVKAVSALGESTESNVVVFTPEDSDDSKSSHSPSHRDDSDRDPDSTQDKSGILCDQY